MDLLEYWGWGKSQVLNKAICAKRRRMADVNGTVYRYILRVRPFFDYPTQIAVYCLRFVPEPRL